MLKYILLVLCSILSLDINSLTSSHELETTHNDNNNNNNLKNEEIEPLMLQSNPETPIESIEGISWTTQQLNDYLQNEELQL